MTPSLPDASEQRRQAGLAPRLLRRLPPPSARRPAPPPDPSPSPIPQPLTSPSSASLASTANSSRRAIPLPLPAPPPPPSASAAQPSSLSFCRSERTLRQFPRSVFDGPFTGDEHPPGMSTPISSLPAAQKLYLYSDPVVLYWISSTEYDFPVNLSFSSTVSASYLAEMVMELINANPVVHEKKERRVRQAPETIDENAAEPIDQLEIFDILTIWLWSLTFPHHIRDIKDPEHPYSLEQLNVVTEDSIELNDESNHVRVTFTPTVEHCSMATIIGLCIRVKLVRSLPPRYKVDIRVAPGSHATEAAVNKQLNDKERVAAALENPNLLGMVEECLSPTFD
ncbi:hypothetical protein U9M48_033671 [Paspalum notatum var. saurae]|uniref:MIP18 family-like domain-containing protein n=1 Tax=Paspalum notatum var. saurae TaxID=547442 RepID=A0AAQ3UB57_PASNO